jgi:hypothetical protein
MSYWFGEPWPRVDFRAPVCEDDARRVPDPAPGELCLFCDESFDVGDQGVVLPHVGADGSVQQRYSHIECLVGTVTGEGGRS